MVNTDRTIKNKQDINNTAEEIFNGRGRFDAVDRRPAKRYYNDKDKDDFIPKPDPNKKEVHHLDKGIKFGGRYVRRRKVYFRIIMVVVLLGLAALFVPPTMSSIPDESEVLFDRNVFESKGMTDFKSYALANYSVYNEASFSSEVSDNYRVVSLKAQVHNMSPLAVKIPQYTAVKVPKKYDEALCYVTSSAVNRTSDGSDPVTGDVIEPFGVEDVTIEIMVNVTDMTDEDFDELITGLVIRTEGTKKRIIGELYIPCLPSVLFVSDNSEMSINP